MNACMSPGKVAEVASALMCLISTIVLKCSVSAARPIVCRSWRQRRTDVLLVSASHLWKPFTVSFGRLSPAIGTFPGSAPAMRSHNTQLNCTPPAANTLK